MKLVIASLNVASSRYEEKANPLCIRIPLLTEFLTTHYAQNKFQILCLQEVRQTGPYSAMDVAIKFYECLCQIEPNVGWEFHCNATTSAPESFRRVIYWRSDQLSHESVENVQFQDDEDYEDGAFLPVHEFKSTNCDYDSPRFTLMNVHAPVTRVEDKTEYWQTVAMAFFHKSCTIAIGDMNKFNEHVKLYKEIFNCGNNNCDPYDLIDNGETTFYSLDTDLKPDGVSHWISSLDGFIVRKDKVEKSSVKIIPSFIKDTTARPTDHFLIIGETEF
jgi:hypothetical protein